MDSDAPTHGKTQFMKRGDIGYISFFQLYLFADTRYHRNSAKTSGNLMLDITIACAQVEQSQMDVLQIVIRWVLQNCWNLKQGPWKKGGQNIFKPAILGGSRDLSSGVPACWNHMTQKNMFALCVIVQEEDNCTSRKKMWWGRGGEWGWQGCDISR